MPCDSTISIALKGKLAIPTLTEALKLLGLNPRVAGEVGSRTVIFDGGSYVEGRDRIEMTSYARIDAGRIQQVYTSQVVAASARRQGFRVEVDRKDPTVLRITSDGRVI